MSDINEPDEMGEEEVQGIRDLPRERVPPAALEERVVKALRAERLLNPDVASPAPELHRPGSTRTGMRPWLVAAAAAGIALFASGVAVGQWMTGRGVAHAVSAALDTDPTQAATQVQETGSEYVRAVARLAELASAQPGDTAEVASGAEAARVALHAAALELARVNPDDPTLKLVLAVLEERAGAPPDSADSGARRTIWF
jgi:hypothetical protein